MGEASGEDDDIDVRKGGRPVPQDVGVAAELADRFDDVVLAVGAREQHHADLRH
jgi:hypothetical protein